ncbi:MAG TPA: YbhB/YbcL family Raf kinase inhibitor-like protein [Myxococcota bacterium]|nr:YbhB/YbcL family Raf kinase inhibitor-like protein [Myxococcota bacterium]
MRCAWILPALLAGSAAAWAPTARGDAATLSLRSSAFEPQAGIPTRYTCDGEDVSPPLAWTDPPAGTRSFALIVDDPDAPDPQAPKTIWVHWVVYDIPAAQRELPQGAGGAGASGGARDGINDWKRTGWRGPCPPIGRHRYVFELFALDAPLGDLGAPSKAALEHAMQGHVLGRAELIATFARAR